ncbi:EthD family reductase [Luteimonas soli]|uniref:EthD family reductase n=1 Tax=Luteimonas soli TaxID=1648966 RepID=A0ABV7XK88_9GAMM
MIRLNILYPNTPGSRFDLDYYFGTHMPMSRRLLGDACKGITLERGIAGAEPGSPAAYVMSCHMLFESIEDFLAIWAQVGDRLGGDIPNYTDVQPLIQFSEVLPAP